MWQFFRESRIPGGPVKYLEALKVQRMPFLLKCQGGVRTQEYGHGDEQLDHPAQYVLIS